MFHKCKKFRPETRTWRYVNDRIFIFEWAKPSNLRLPLWEMSWHYSCTESPNCRFSVCKAMYFNIYIYIYIYIYNQTHYQRFSTPFSIPKKFKSDFSYLDWAASLRVYYNYGPSKCSYWNNNLFTATLPCVAQLAKLWKHVLTCHFLCIQTLTEGRTCSNAAEKGMCEVCHTKTRKPFLVFLESLAPTMRSTSIGGSQEIVFKWKQ